MALRGLVVWGWAFVLYYVFIWVGLKYFFSKKEKLYQFFPVYSKNLLYMQQYNPKGKQIYIVMQNKIEKKKLSTIANPGHTAQQYCEKKLQNCFVGYIWAGVENRNVKFFLKRGCLILFWAHIPRILRRRMRFFFNTRNKFFFRWKNVGKNGNKTQRVTIKKKVWDKKVKVILEFEDSFCCCSIYICSSLWLVGLRVQGKSSRQETKGMGDFFLYINSYTRSFAIKVLFFAAAVSDDMRCLLLVVVGGVSRRRFSTSTFLQWQNGECGI